MNVMLADWLEELNDNEYRNKRDTLMGIIYSLRITDKRTIKIITGWTDDQIRGAFRRIRELGSHEKESWLRSWQPRQRAPFVYTLGEKGIEHVRALKDYALGYEESELSIRGQVAHFMGTNNILVRAKQAKLPVLNWYSQKDTMSFLFYQLRPMKSPVNPDAMIKFANQTYFLEFDTGSENGGRLEGKIHRYMMLSAIKEGIFPVIWVTPKPSRIKLITQKAKEALTTYEIKMKEECRKRKLTSGLPKKMPLMYAFVEGEETPFLAGSHKATPILGTE
jgi:hypothetical protein